METRSFKSESRKGSSSDSGIILDERAHEDTRNNTEIPSVGSSSTLGDDSAGKEPPSESPQLDTNGSVQDLGVSQSSAPIRSLKSESPTCRTSFVMPVIASRLVTYNLVYYGCAVLDRRFTVAMLPWIVASVKKRDDKQDVVLQITVKSISAAAAEATASGSLLFEHRINGVSRFARAIYEKSVFCYLYRSETESPFYCYVFQAQDSETVVEIVRVVRQATKEFQADHQGLAHTQEEAAGPGTVCKKFEVIYCGKVMVGDKKASVSLVDELVVRFDQRERGGSQSETSSCSSSRFYLDSGVGGGGADAAPTPTPTDSVPDSVPDSAISMASGSTPLLASADKSAMLFQVGKYEIHTISLVKQTTVFTKKFKDISFCSQGVKNSSSFGFICREKIQGKNYMCYVFKCNSESVVDEIMMTLKQAFHSALQQSKTYVVCETCPMHLLHKLCQELEGKTLEETNSILLKNLELFCDGHHQDTIAQLKEANLNSMQEENELLMSSIHDLCEDKQSLHTHIGTDKHQPLPADQGQRSPHQYASPPPSPREKVQGSKFDVLKSKAKKSLASSFESMFKIKSKGPGERVSAAFDNDGYRSRSSTLDDTPSDPAKISPKSGHRSKLAARSLNESPLAAKEPVVVVAVAAAAAAAAGKTVNAAASQPSSRQADFEKRLEAAADLRSSETKALTERMNLSPGMMRKRSSTIAESPLPPTPPSPKLVGPCNTPSRAKLLRMTTFHTPATLPRTDHSDRSIFATPRRKGSWRQAIFNRVVTPINKTSPINKSIIEESSDEEEAAGDRRWHNVRPDLRSSKGLRALWRKTILEQILLLRMDKQNKSLRADQDAVSAKRKKLNYEEITPCLKEVSKEWDAMLNHPERPDYCVANKTLLKTVKAGVPCTKRGEIWQLLTEQHLLGSTAPASPLTSDAADKDYTELLKQLTPHQHAILLDLGRTFPTHPYFSTQLGAGQLALFNLLKAYSLIDSEVGYCQGLSFVAGVLLMHATEDKAFEMLRFLLSNLGIRRQYKPDMVALQLQMYQLSRLLHDYYRPLYDHLEQNEIAPSLYAAPWFLTLFASQFPMGFVARVFDLVFLQGVEVIMKVALVILGSHSELILQCEGFETIVDFLKQTLPDFGMIQMERTINQVYELDISKQLHAYEVEYYLLQEEMLTSPTKDDEDLIDKLEEQNRGLKRQNMDLLEQLQAAHTTVQNQEGAIHSLHTSHSKLRAHLRTLEQERAALLSYLAKLRKLVPPANMADHHLQAAMTSELRNSFLAEVAGAAGLVEDELEDIEVSGFSNPAAARSGWGGPAGSGPADAKFRHISGDSLNSSCSESSASTSDARDINGSPALMGGPP